MVTAGLAARLDARAGRSASWFRPYVAGYYAYHLLGEDLSREEVEARMEALLAAGQPWKTLMGVEANRRHRSQLAASPVIAESNGLRESGLQKC